MKKIALLFACFLNQAFSMCCCEESPWWARQHPILEAKVGYFFFTDSSMNRVFDDGGIDVQLSGSYPFYKLLNVYLSVEYLQKSGHSTGGHQKVSLWEVPVSLGLKPIFPITDFIQYYFTIGPRYFYVHVHNHSSYVPTNMSANGCGGFVNTGFNFIFDNHFLVDLFAEYSFKKLSFHSHKSGTKGLDAEVGGLTFGGGLGYAF
jgi:hypothetical protein